MIKWCCFLIVASSLARPGVFIDRIAVIVGRTPILDSDVNTDLRVTAFLNHAPLDFSAVSRKQAANRLINQELIRKQIRLGGYRIAPRSEAEAFLKSIEKSRDSGAAYFQTELSRYGITEALLLDRLAWQLTVLGFIDTMFRPQVTVSDADVRHYYDSHLAAFSFEPITQVRPAIVETITGERINSLFDHWLETNRKAVRITFLEKSLA
jgi:hypothetical protein